MRKTLMTIAAAALAATSFTIKAEAMPFGGLGTAADTLAAVEKSQFFYGGRNYCWYPDGWHGPGFYWCGYAFRPGFGWGGPVGWRGWHHGGPRRGVVVGPRGGAMVVGPRGGRAFVGGGGGPRMGGGGGGGPRMGGGGGRGGPRTGGGGGGGGGRRH